MPEAPDAIAYCLSSKHRDLRGVLVKGIEHLRPIPSSRRLDLSSLVEGPAGGPAPRHAVRPVPKIRTASRPTLSWVPLVAAGRSNTRCWPLTVALLWQD